MERLELDAQISITVKDLKWDGRLKDIVRIDVNNINEELVNQPTIVAWFGVVMAEGISLYEDIKEKTERLYSKVYLEVRERLEKAGAKVTEAVLQHTVVTDVRYIEMQEELARVRRQANILKSIIRSLEHRRSSIEQLSTNKRKENVSEKFLGESYQDDDGVCN